MRTRNTELCCSTGLSKTLTSYESFHKPPHLVPPGTNNVNNVVLADQDRKIATSFWGLLEISRLPCQCWRFHDLGGSGVVFVAFPLPSDQTEAIGIEKTLCFLIFYSPSAQLRSGKGKNTQFADSVSFWLEVLITRPTGFCQAPQSACIGPVATQRRVACLLALPCPAL